MVNCCKFLAVHPSNMNQFQEGRQFVNRCTPWHHLKCVYITAKEVYKDGKEGRSTRHWWRMSYIGKACSNKYGMVLGTIYESLFAIPHYMTMALVNALGLVAYLFKKA